MNQGGDSWPGRGRVKDVGSGSVTPSSPGRYQLRHAGHGGLAILPEDAVIGRGGIARVLLAYDTHLGREVAIKELVRGDGVTAEPPDHTVVRFLREARVTGQLEHPGIMPVYELGRREDGSLYYTMKVVRGRTLESALRACTGLSDRLALLEHFVHVCNAVAYAHSRGVVHRDLKPQNIMLGEFGETVVLDWGIAKIRSVPDAPVADVAGPTDSVHTLDGRAMGTPAYMSPEQAAGSHGEIDESTDVWALGVILFELLTGRPPFVGDHAELVMKAVREDTVPTVGSLEPGAPPELAAICDRALQRDQVQRYPSARLVAEEVGAWQHGGYVRAYDYALTELLSRFARRHRAVLTVAVLSAVAMGFIATAGYRRMASERDRALALEGVAASREAALRVSVSEAQAEKSRRALDAGDAQAAELLAAAALVNGDQPEARGVLLSLEGRVRPRLAWQSRPGAGCWDLARLPGGDLVACARNGGVVLLDARSWSETRRLGGHDGDVPALAVVGGEGGGPGLLTGGWDGRVILWNTRDWTPVVQVQHPGRVWALDGSPDGSVVASAGDDGVVRLWDLETGAQTGALEAGDGPLFGVAFIDGDHVAAGGLDGPIHIWDLRAGHRTELAGHPSGVRALASGGPAMLLSGGYDGEVVEWRLGQATARVVARHDGAVLEVARLAGGEIVSTGVDGQVIVSSRSASASLTGHQGPVLAALGVGGLLLSSGQDGTLRAWDVSTGTELRRASGHGGPLVAVSAARDVPRVASMSRDRTLRVWEGETGRELLLAVSGGLPSALAISADGTRLAVGTEQGVLHRVQVRDGATVSSTPLHQGAIAAVAWFEDGERVLTAGHDGRVMISGADSGRELGRHAGPVLDLALSGDETRVASAAEDGTARVWDPTGGAAPRVLGPLGGGVTSVAFSPDGALLAAGVNDRTARVWSVGSGEEIGRMDHPDRVGSIVWSPDGTLLVSAAGDRIVRAWGVGSWGEQARIGVPGVATVDLAFDPVNGRLVTAGDDAVLRTWALDLPAWRGVLDVGAPALSVRWLGDDLVCGTREGALVRLGLHGGAARVDLAHEGEVYGLDVDRATAAVLSAGFDGVIRLWGGSPSPQGAFGAPLELWRSPVGALLSVDLSPDGNLVAASGAGAVMVLERRSGAVLATLRGHEGWVSQVRFSPDNRKLATAGDDHSVRVWSMEDGAEAFHLTGHRSEVLSVDWSSDGELLAAGAFDGEVRVWDAANGAEETAIAAHRGGVRALRFTPDGHLVTSGYDHQVRLWDPRRGTELLRFTGHLGPVTDLGLSPDGAMLASASDDGTVHLDPLRLDPIDAAARLARARADFGQVVDGIRILPDPARALVVLAPVEPP